jgi:hypothetical protein
MQGILDADDTNQLILYGYMLTFLRRVILNMSQRLGIEVPIADEGDRAQRLMSVKDDGP